MISAIASCALLAPGSAGAATVVNGGFESGNLDGWTQVNSPAGQWAAYFGNLIPSEREEVEEEEVEYEECLEGAVDPEECLLEPEPETFFEPPFGKFAAVSEQGNVSGMALYQDVALEPGQTHQLAMTLYYTVFKPIIVPTPNSLSLDVENEQYRVDVMKPSAPISSLEPSDILATVFASKPGDPQVLDPTRFTTDLSAFAGQTVRIRLVTVVTAGELNGAADDISITSTPIPPPSNIATKGKLTLNKKKGTGTLSVTVPGPGVLAFADAKKGKKKVLKPTSLNPTGAGTVKVAIKPNGKGKKALKKTGKLQFKGKLTFTPAGGSAATQPVAGKLKLKLPRR